MRSLRLARIAAEAEVLRLRRQVQRAVIRLVLALIALPFLAAALAFAHVAAWFALTLHAGLPPWATALMLMAADLVLGGLLVLIAVFRGPGRVEIEALQVRQRALENAGVGLSVAGLLIPALRMATSLLRKPKA